MKRSPHWIKHTHLFDDPNYECSVCGHHFSSTTPSCPACGSRLTWTSDPQDWVDEAEMLDIILGDD